MSAPLTLDTWDASESRYGRDGNTEVLDWCPVCVEYVASVKTTCPWCDSELLPDRPTADVIQLVPVEPPTAEPPKIPPRRDRRHNHGKAFTDEQILARMRLWAQVTGAPPSKDAWTPAAIKLRAGAARQRIERLMTTVALYEGGDWPSEITVRAHFGSWTQAMLQAGFEPRPPGRPPKSENAVLPQKPRTGPNALEEYKRNVDRARELGDKAMLKGALYQLAMSAIIEGDHIAGHPADA